MPYYSYGFDWTYLILVLPCVVLAMLASGAVRSTFSRYSRVLCSGRLTGAQAAQRVLRENGVTDVRIERVGGELTDHYDPKAHVIRLSDGVYDACTVAAVGVACHEAGHAVQYARGYAPIKLRAAIIPVTNIGSKLAMPLILLGLILSLGETISYGFIYAGIACFGLSTVFQLITLPVEFDASRRAMRAIRDGGLLTADECRGARKTLTAAAMTYVASLAVSLAQLLRLIVLFGGGRSKRRD